MPKGVYDRSKSKARRELDRLLSEVAPKPKKKVTQAVMALPPQTKFLVVNRDCSNNEGWFDALPEAETRAGELINDERADPEYIVILEVVASYKINVKPNAVKTERIEDVDW